LSSRTDKIARKKEQNKTAASRYREKKKLLQRIISSEEEELLAVNKVLTNKREGVQREVSLLKQLLRELFNDRKLKFK
jgi:cyclic AMP-dependent transcription factor ATF-4